MRNHTAFRPGFWLMRRMRFSLKLAILATVVLLPLLVVVFQLVSKQREDNESTRVELSGIELIDQSQKIIQAFQSKQPPAQLLQSMDASLQAAHSDIAAKDWSALRERLVAASDGSKAWASEATTRQPLVADMRRFVYGLGKDSGLLFDPDPLTYLIMDMVVSRTLPWTETAQGILLLVQEGDNATPGGASMLGAAVAALDNGNRDIAYAMAQIQDFGAKEAGGQAALAASDELLKTLKARLAPASADQSADAIVAVDTKLIAFIQAYQSAGVQQVHELLQARLQDGQQRVWMIALGSACGVLLMLYFLVSLQFSFMADLRQVMAFMEQTAQGNLRHQVVIEGHDELSHMTTAMHSMVANLSSMVASVRSNAALVSHAGSSLVDGNHALSDRTEQQAANLEQTAASVQELSGTVKSTAEAASSADASARTVRDQAEGGLQSMAAAIESVVTIQNSTKRMDEVVGVIDGLAFQTNILALNAAVEAARAGESGRGFAVVASEVRSLAQRSSASAKEIRQLIATSSKQVDDGVLEIRSVGQRIEKIVEGIRDLTLRFSEISTSSNEQSIALTEITAAVRQLDEITQKNASMVEYAVDQSSDLQSRAQHLGRAVSAFHLQQGTAEEAQALVAAALRFRERCASPEEFVRAITSSENPFFDRDMYVFVLDANGTYLGFGGNASRVGERVQNIAGIDGAGLMQKIMSQANKGPGWVEYEISHPATGRVQEKMSYVARVDAHYVGCGVYKNYEGV